jgi:hypothetical protein
VISPVRFERSVRTASCTSPATLSTVVTHVGPKGRVASLLVFGPDHDPAVVPRAMADYSAGTLGKLAVDVGG